MSNATKDQTVQLLETNGNAVVNFIAVIYA